MSPVVNLVWVHGLGSLVVVVGVIALSWRSEKPPSLALRLVWIAWCLTCYSTLIAMFVGAL